MVYWRGRRSTQYVPIPYISIPSSIASYIPLTSTKFSPPSLPQSKNKVLRQQAPNRMASPKQSVSPIPIPPLSSIPAKESHIQLSRPRHRQVRLASREPGDRNKVWAPVGLIIPSCFETPLVKETMKALHDLVESGKVRYIDAASSMWAHHYDLFPYLSPITPFISNS